MRSIFIKLLKFLVFLLPTEELTQNTLLDRKLKFKKVKGVGTFYYEHDFWSLKKEISVAWSPFLFRIFLEDSQNTFTNENIIYMNSLLNDIRLKNEIERLLYAHYLNLIKLNKTMTEQPHINLPEDIWKLLGSVGIPYGVINLEINHNQTIAMRFGYFKVIGGDIIIRGKLDHLVLELIGFQK
jgi:hypothetical protein